MLCYATKHDAKVVTETSDFRLQRSSLNITCRFVKRHLHGGPPDVVDTDALQQRIRELEEQNKKLESELALVKQQVNSIL